MLYDHRQIIYEEDCHIKPGRHMEITFNTDFQDDAAHCHFKLRLRGRNGLQSAWLCEGGIPCLYRDIDDSLSDETDHSRFSLRIHADGEDFPRRAYYKLLFPPDIFNSQFNISESFNTDDTAWVFRCLVKTEQFTVLPGGSCEIRFERYLRKDGRDPRDISGVPDETLTLPLPGGTQDWTALTKDIRIDNDTAAILITIAVEQAQGTVWLEEPALRNCLGDNNLPDFDLTNHYHPFLNWMGENLSHREWSDLQIILNGRHMDPQSIFQRCHAGSENEIYLPDGWVQNGENRLELHNTSNYFHADPYILSRAEILWEVSKPVRIICAPEYPVKNQPFSVLLQTDEPDVRIHITADEGILAPSGADYEEAGLHVLTLTAGDCGSRLNLTVTAQGLSDTACIRRIVERPDDNIITGTGDSIYIPQEIREMEDFLCWYCSEHLGNMITFRPVYRWSGSRTLKPDTWKRLISLLNRMQLYYCQMIDGRELPGINANPTLEMMDGTYFIGNQGHERDGAFYYWGAKTSCHDNDTFYEEIFRRVMQHPDFKYIVPIDYTEEKEYYFFNPLSPRTMKDAAEQFVEQFRIALQGIKRHTGPSTLFKYWFEAGLEVGGAELMYGPMEVVLSALRGASLAYDRKEFAAHHAVQWSTTPHDTPSRYRRYWLALFISYMQGCSTINTEEGLYRMEENFSQLDRYSEACMHHADVQREFYRFVQTHSRRGRLNSPIALLHGRYDAWVCFTRRPAWAHEGEKWIFNTPEESWDLIKVFYPDAVLNAIYRHPCPDSPQGFYSRTPYGTVDILPVEASVEKYGIYDFMAFLGFNAATEDQLDKLTGYVENGGKLLLGWCHLFTDTNRSDVLSGTPHPLDATRLLDITLEGFLPEKDGLTLGKVRLGSDITVLEERNGVPFLLSHRLGDGIVFFINAREYPAASAIRPVYEKALRDFGDMSLALHREKGWMSSSDTVETAVYDREDGHRTIYAVNTDWWSTHRPLARTNLLLGNSCYGVDIPRDKITIATIRKDIAVITSDMETDILEIHPQDSGFTLHLQGGDTAEISICVPYEITSSDITVSPGMEGFIIRPKLCGEKHLQFMRV